jgi:DNA replication and repair protein RecF
VVVKSVEVRDFRSYAAARIALCEGLTVLHGPNGSGKTNLLEAAYCACTGRGIRSNRDRELVRFSAPCARVAAMVRTRAGAERRLTVDIEAGTPRRVEVDGRRVDSLSEVEQRPLVSVFMAERLALINGPPGARRAHLDNLATALWPARAADRRGYSEALRQRSALLAALRGGQGRPGQLDAWDSELARASLPLMEGRAGAVRALQGQVGAQARELGLAGKLTVEYRPSLPARDEDDALRRLHEVRAADLEAGFCTRGPHRDELVVRHDGRPLRVYGSQGERRLGLLALLLAEREVIAQERDTVPLMLLDDVMSELDGTRRARLAAQLAGDGQSVITATDRDQVPAAPAGAVADVEVPDGVRVPAQCAPARGAPPPSAPRRDDAAPPPSQQAVRGITAGRSVEAIAASRAA